ncbi:Hypothetical protein R9X50_00602100 [Acrodontium crateriforme]|uniref:Uncharacterized protein n=1 Tax=Acrodontium crateriforme TaxID=150365 RepID=A0AAQ3M8A5_9PEZI|nr:Hypothetical protein R9X50_00602100 [Acrodontium crateriforme]
MSLSVGLAAFLLATSRVQAVTNPELSVQGCDQLTCPSSARNDSICSANNIGVGIASNAVNVSKADTTLTLTLVDGYPIGIYQTFPYVNFTTRSLYLGAPSNADLKAQAPGCALLMQYDQATFPYSDMKTLPDSFFQNTTSCPTSLTEGDTMQSLASVIQQFRYSNSSLLRCEALSAFVQYTLNHQNSTLGAFSAPLISVTGGAVSGPDVATSPAKIIDSVAGTTSSSCKPVKPSDYDLYDVASATQILRDEPMSQNLTYGGRDGFTPVVSVMYADDDDTNPDVAVLCMHLYNGEGQLLPFSTINEPTGGATTVKVAGWGTIFTSVLVGVWTLL